MARREIAMLGAGCFWKPEFEFSKIEGVVSTQVGYSGGSEKYKSPSYEEVCSDKTGHVEVVQVVFDPDIVSYEDLLKTFWKIHNPTQLNQQGFDVGSQYRSVIFYYNLEQKKKAEKSLREEQKKREEKIVTAIEKAKEFYRAEETHQKYLEKRGAQSCGI